MIKNSPVYDLHGKICNTWQKDGKSSSSILLSDATELEGFCHKSLMFSNLIEHKKSSGEMAEWSNALVC